MSSTLSRLRGLMGKNGKVDYDRAKELARDADPAIRRELARRTDLTPELLYYLAEDADPDVRMGIARNPETPAQADLLLTGDADERVREELAVKIARVAPGLSAAQQDKVKKIAYQALTRLVEDQLPRVRQVLAEALKDVADAPPEIIRRLAYDTEIVVAGPVLEFSPVLTDADLLALIESGPIKGVLSAISRRATVTEKVSEAIVKADDVGAITELLKNPSAQIREETLDRLVDRSRGVAVWQEPLVHRPKLHGGATIRLAQFVAHSLVEVLMRRNDLTPEIAVEVARVVDRRIAEEDGFAPPDGAEPLDGATRKKVHELGPEWERALQAAFDKASALRDEGALTEPAVRTAVESGESDFVHGALAVLADLTPKQVVHVLESHSAKAVAGLSWAAGLSADFSVALQTMLAHIPPEKAVKPTDEGGYPLSDQELLWQLEMFTT